MPVSKKTLHFRVRLCFRSWRSKVSRGAKKLSLAAACLFTIIFTYIVTDCLQNPQGEQSKTILRTLVFSRARNEFGARHAEGPPTRASFLEKSLDNRDEPVILRLILNNRDKENPRICVFSSHPAFG